MIFFFQRNPVSSSSEYVDELEKIGHIEVVELINLQDAGFFYIHRACAAWSFGIIREPNGMLSNVGQIVQSSLPRKCTFCNHFGASLACKVQTETVMKHNLNAF
jgi:[histone H3]-lysine4 N-trimethyltransferase MLL3